MQKPKEPSKTFFVEKTYTCSWDKYYPNKWISFDHLLKVKNEHIPAHAKDIRIAVEEDYNEDDGSILNYSLYLSWKEETDNLKYDKQLEKYHKQLAKWQKENAE